jgi:hypothetical protein
MQNDVLNALLLISSLACSLVITALLKSWLDESPLLWGGVKCNTHINHRIIGRINPVFRNTALRAEKNTA